MADSKLKTFFDENKLNTARVLAVSHKLETLRHEDRRMKLDKVRAKKGSAEGGGEGGGGEKAEPQKPRSGRAVTPRAIRTALAGGTVSGPTKQRILRAVNYLLAQKKKDKVDLRVLF